MNRKKIGIITDTKNGIILGETLKNASYDVIICICDDRMKMGSERKKYLSGLCDEKGLVFVFDTKSLTDSLCDHQSVIFLLKNARWIV